MKPLLPMDPDAAMNPADQMLLARKQKRQPMIGMGKNTNLTGKAKQHLNYVSSTMAKLYPDLV